MKKLLESAWRRLRHPAAHIAVATIEKLKARPQQGEMLRQLARKVVVTR